MICEEWHTRYPKYVLVLCSLGEEGDRNISLIWKAFELSPRNLDRQRCLGWTSYVAWFEGNVSKLWKGRLLEKRPFPNERMDKNLELNKIGFKNRK